MLFIQFDDEWSEYPLTVCLHMQPLLLHIKQYVQGIVFMWNFMMCNDMLNVDDDDDNDDVDGFWWKCLVTF